MKLKICLLITLILVSSSAICQQSINNYKYIVVPKKYDFLKSEDQYQLNSLTKFLFEKEGFQTLFDSDIRTQDFAQKPCLGLMTKVIDNSSMFASKLVIELINCKNEVVFTSTEGRSKIKEYKKGYYQALRMAFQSITDQKYNYEPGNKPVAASGQVKKEEAVVVGEQAKKEEAVISNEEDEEQEPTKIIKEDVPVEKKAAKKVKETAIAAQIKTSEKVKEIEEKKPEKIRVSKNLLYAQPNAKGYQLVDSTPRVIYILLKSSKKDLYILKNKNGILTKDGEKWFAEYYKGGNLVKEELQIKF